METIRIRLQKLLEANEQIMDNQPSDDLYLEWAQLALAVSDLMDGFEAVLKTAKATRDKQTDFFKARRAKLDTHKLLGEAQELEKDLDKLVKHWQNQMAPPTAQTSLF